MKRRPSLRPVVRSLFPLTLRQRRAERIRRRRDGRQQLSFADGTGGAEWPVRISLTQPIMPSTVYEAKVANLQRGAELISESLVGSDEFWSFWHRLGEATEGNGFQKGRNIVGGNVELHLGGGLCQLSSLLYHLALLSELDIIERHPHSVDIYREEERFTPLGADATVVWGYKDLRLHNRHPFPVSIGCYVANGTIVGQIRSEHELAEHRVEFRRVEHSLTTTEVHTLIDGKKMTETLYHRPFDTRSM